MQLEARMQFDPALHGWRLVSSVVVNDEMEIETGRGLLVDQFEKAQELAVSMPRHAGPDDGAVQHVQSREQGGGAVALVVVGHGAGTPLLHGQSRLSAVEGLDLALFVDAQDQRLVGWIEIEPDHVLHFGGEVFVTRDLERFDQVQLEAVGTPDPLHCCRRRPPPRPCCARSMGRIRRLLVQRHVHHLLDLIGDSGLTRDGGCVLQQPVHPLRHIAAAPAADGSNFPTVAAIASALSPSLPATRSAPAKPPSARVPVPHKPFQPFASAR